MRLTELIEELKQQLRDHGDVEVVTPDWMSDGWLYEPIASKKLSMLSGVPGLPGVGGTSNVVDPKAGGFSPSMAFKEEWEMHLKLCPPKNYLSIG